MMFEFDVKKLIPKAALSLDMVSFLQNKLLSGRKNRKLCISTMRADVGAAIVKETRTNKDLRLFGFTCSYLDTLM